MNLKLSRQDRYISHAIETRESRRDSIMHTMIKNILEEKLVKRHHI